MAPRWQQPGQGWAAMQTRRELRAGADATDQPVPATAAGEGSDGDQKDADGGEAEAGSL